MYAQNASRARQYEPHLYLSRGASVTQFQLFLLTFVEKGYRLQPSGVPQQVGTNTLLHFEVLREPSAHRNYDAHRIDFQVERALQLQNSSTAVVEVVITNPYEENRVESVHRIPYILAEPNNEPKGAIAPGRAHYFMDTGSASDGQASFSVLIPFNVSPAKMHLRGVDLMPAPGESKRSTFVAVRDTVEDIMDLIIQLKEYQAHIAGPPVNQAQYFVHVLKRY